MPGLGALFSSNARAEDRVELIVILSPQIVERGGAVSLPEALERLRLRISDVES